MSSVEPIVPAARELGDRKPIIILTTARSGSSVVSAMLGQHPDTFAFPELVLFAGDTVGDAVRAGRHGPEAPNYGRLVGLVRAIALAQTGSQHPDAVSEAARWLQVRHRWPVELVLDYVFDSVRPLVPIEKSPDTTNSDANLERALRLYPHARFLHLVRHPITTVASMIRHWRAFPWAQMLGDQYPDAVARHWVLSQRRTLLFGSRVGRSQYARVRAEDLVNTPKDTLPPLLCTLGLTDHPSCVEQMTHPEDAWFAYPGGGDDPSFLEDPRLRGLPEPTRWEVPKEWGVTRNTQSAMRALASVLGYPTADAHDARRLVSPA